MMPIDCKNWNTNFWFSNEWESVQLVERLNHHHSLIDFHWLDGWRCRYVDRRRHLIHVPFHGIQRDPDANYHRKSHQFHWPGWHLVVTVEAMDSLKALDYWVLHSLMSSGRRQENRIN